MKERIKDIWPTKLKAARNRKPMTTSLLVLLLIIFISTILFGLLLFRSSLDDADFWLKVISGELAALTFLVGIGALISGHFAGQRQAEKVADALLEAGRANERAEELAKQNLATESRLEEERRNRIGLEEWLKPRVLPFTYAAGKSSIDPLKPFAGTQVIFEVIDDDEARGLANQIASSVQAAGWEIVRAESRPKGPGIADGVTIESKRNIPDPNRPETMTTPLAPAARTLRDLLKANNLQAAAYEVNVTWPAGVPDKVLFIKVGLKPDTYFSKKSALEFWQKRLEEEKDPQQKKKLEAMIEQIKNLKP